jgi:dephospho-CoA kinase
MPTIGLTGNFGMGKSTVLGFFNTCGAYTYSADDIVHTILEKQAIIKKIADVLGKDVVLSGSGKGPLNKTRVANIIFEDTQKRYAVEKIIHPEVLKVMKRTISDISHENPEAAIIFEVPLLFESGYDTYFNKTIVVYCNRDIAIKRLARKGFSKDDVIKRTGAQMAITKKKKLADYVINNNDTIEKTKMRVKSIYDKLTRHCLVKNPG